MTVDEIVQKKKIGTGLIYRWAKEFRENGNANGNDKAHAKAPGSSTALVPVSGAGKGKRYPESMKQKVYAMLRKGTSAANASSISAVPIKTIYGWIAREKKRNAVVVEPRAMVDVQAEGIESPSATAVIAAASQAHTLLKNARLDKLDAIRSNAPGAANFPNDFLLGQLAYNKLATVFGVK